MLRKLYLIGGALALFAASLGFIALNIESISKLASPEVEDIVDDSQNLVATQASNNSLNLQSLSATLLPSDSTVFSDNSQMKLLNQLNGLNSKYFGSTTRIDTHIFTDRLVYTAGELVIIAIHGTDPFTKAPVYLAAQSDAVNLLYCDMHDVYGNAIHQSYGYYYGTGAACYLSIPTTAWTATYTIRVYGQNFAAQYKQVRVLGSRDYFTDFPVTATTDQPLYAPGDKVTVTYSIPIGYGAEGLNVTSILAATFEQNNIVSNLGWVVASQTSLTQATISITIPKSTAIAENYLSLNVTFFDGIYIRKSSVIIPLLVRQSTIQGFIWTDSFAPVVDGTVQTFFVYAYYGSASDFPNRQAFLFPVNQNNLIIYMNTTSPITGRAQNGVVIKGPTKNFDGTGLVSFISSPSIRTDRYYFKVQGPQGLSRVYNLNFYSYFTDLYTRTSEPEIYISLQSRILTLATQPLVINVWTNQYLSKSTVFLLMVKQKEKIILSQFYTFTPAPPTYTRTHVYIYSTQIKILPAALPSNPGGYSVLLYKITTAWQNYDTTISLTDSSQQDIDTVNSWLDLRGVVFFYQKFQTPSYRFQQKFDTTPNYPVYYPADVVNYGIQVYDNSNKTVTKDVYLNIAITDVNSNYGLPKGTLGNSQLAYRLFVENEILFPTYSKSTIEGFQLSLNTSVNAAVLATQVLRYLFSDFQGYKYIELYGSSSALPEQVQIVQRYFGSSLQQWDASAWEAFLTTDKNNNLIPRPFTTYIYVFHNAYLGLSSRKLNYNGFSTYRNFQTTANNFGQTSKLQQPPNYGLGTYHTWYAHAGYNNGNYDFSATLDFTQTMYVGHGVYAQNGYWQSSFVTNDNNTQYQTYVEGYSLDGGYGQASLTNLISTSNIGRPAPYTIVNPPINSFMLGYDDLTIFYNFTNNFNFDFNTNLSLTTTGTCNGNFYYYYNQVVVPKRSGLNVLEFEYYSDDVDFAYDDEGYLCKVYFNLDVNSTSVNTTAINVHQKIESYYFNQLPNGIIVQQYDAGILGQNITSITGDDPNYQTKTLSFTTPTDEETSEQFAGYFEFEVVFDIMSQVADLVWQQLQSVSNYYYLINGYYDADGRRFYFGQSYTFQDFLTAAFVVDKLYYAIQHESNSNTILNGFLGEEGSDGLLQFFEFLYSTFSLYWNENDRGYSNTIGGPVDDTLSILALYLLGNSQIPTIDDDNTTALAEFVIQGTNLRQTTGIYYDPYNPLSMVDQTNNQTSQLWVRALALMGLSSSFIQNSPGFNAISAKIAEDIQDLYMYAHNMTDACEEAEGLYFIGLAMLAISNYEERADNNTYLGGYFQYYMDDYGQFPVIEVQNSLFFSSVYNRHAEMQALGTYVQAIAGYQDQSVLCWYGLTWYQERFTFGGHAATLFGTLAAIEIAMKGFNAFTTLNDDTGSFEIIQTVSNPGDVFKKIASIEVDGGNEQVLYYYYADPNGPALTYTAYGYDTNYGISTNPDINPYIFVSTYLDFNDHPSSYTVFSPLELTLYDPVIGNGQTLGSIDNLWQTVIFSIRIQNIDPNNRYRSIVIGFGVPSCLYFDPSMTQDQIEPTYVSIWGVDQSQGILYFNVFTLDPNSAIEINFYLIQNAVGSCDGRVVFAQLNGDNESLIYKFMNFG